MLNVIVSESRSYTTVRADALKGIFYDDYSDEDVALAKLLPVSQAKALLVPSKTDLCPLLHPAS
jgi:hypothetical protein